MRRPKGRRSSRRVETWTCNKGHRNPPESHEFFDIPTMECGCDCGQEYLGDFDFSLSNVIVNGQRLLGKPMDQGTTELCLAHSFAKQMEITKRAKAVLKNKRLTDSFVMNALHLHRSVEAILRRQPDLPTAATVIMMARVLKTRGIRSEDGKTIYKASDVKTIRSEDIVKILRALADGFPLNASFSVGKRFGASRYCRSYKPPSNAKMMDKLQMAKLKASANPMASASEPFTPAHAVVLVGAKRENGKLDYYYMNSWKDFCIRRDNLGRRIPDLDGIGKIAADRLLRNVVRISRFKEEQTDRSFVPEQLPVDLDRSRNFSLLVD